jgi:aspartokinase/homoserine dehydrogenase 1
MFYDAEGVNPDRALEELREHGKSATLDDIVSTLSSSHLERLVFVDATASSEVADRYADLLGNGIAVVTPNKLANTRDQAYYERLRRLARDRNLPFLYETTVGAALPIIQVVQNLVRSGDTIHRLRGILSGTLAFVFNAMRGGASFSESVLEARRRGFTEPDPREDLAGEDVARKLLTLARETGLRVERGDMHVESLVPAALEGLGVDEFLARLPDYDDEWKERLRNGGMQYVATLDTDGCRVGLERVEPGSPFDALAHTDNMVVVESDRYSERPLVVQGAGAGPLLTASGILNDIMIATERMR